MEMRKSLKESPITPSTPFQGLAKPDLTDPKKKKAVKKDQPTAGKPKSNIFDVQQVNEAKEEEEVDMLERIIKEKLPKRDLLEYLQNYANDLTLEKMK